MKNEWGTFLPWDWPIPIVKGLGRIKPLVLSLLEADTTDLPTNMYRF
jgi:hypothetical protein